MIELVRQPSVASPFILHVQCYVSQRKLQQGNKPLPDPLEPPLTQQNFEKYKEMYDNVGKPRKSQQILVKEMPLFPLLRHPLTLVVRVRGCACFAFAARTKFPANGVRRVRSDLLPLRQTAYRLRRSTYNGLYKYRLLLTAYDLLLATCNAHLLTY